MQKSEAYSILGISPDSSPEEAKKQYRKLMKQFHPDLNKDADAERKSKEINEAYQVISSPEPEENSFFPGFHGFSTISLEDLFPFNQQKTYFNSPLILESNITFAESVLGSTRELKYSRQTKCTSCEGQGTVSDNNSCAKCHGKGKFVSSQNGSVFIQTCPACHGKTKKSPCQPCNKKGTVTSEVSIKVNIPGGVKDSNILNLRSMGHYIGSFGSTDQYADAHLRIHVAADDELSLVDNQVVSNLTLSLKEALMGCQKTVKTVLEPQNIVIPPRSKHKEEISIPNFGVNKQGSHKIILNVTYPDNVDSLLGVL